MRNDTEAAGHNTTSPLSTPPPHASTSTHTNPKPTVSPTSPAALMLADPEADQLRPFRYKLALATIIGFPILASLPPRKLDIYTFGLGMGWVLALNEVAEQKKHMSLLKIVGGGLREQRMAEHEKEEKRRAQESGWKGEAIRRAREDEEEGLGIAEMIGKTVREAFGISDDIQAGSVLEEVEKIKEKK